MQFFHRKENGERGGLRPGGIPGRDPAVAEEEIGRSRLARARRSRCVYGWAGVGRALQSLFHAGVRSRAGLAAGGVCQAAHGGLKTPSWAMMVAMSSAAHSSLILPSVTR